jgi:hypothetical protein
MILLVTPNLRGEECAAALSEVTGEEVSVAESLRQATGLLRTNSYISVVFDQYLLETEAEETETLMQHLGMAIPVQVNLAVSGLDRLAREVRAAVQRRKREEVVARRAAERMLYSELNGTITALLLQCELAMAAPGMPEVALEKVDAAHALVKKLREQLHSPENNN